MPSSRSVYEKGGKFKYVINLKKNWPCCLGERGVYPPASSGRPSGGDKILAKASIIGKKLFGRLGVKCLNICGTLKKI